MTRMRASTLVLGYIAAAALFGGLLVYFHLPTHFIAILVVPVFLAVMNYPRLVYVLMTLIFLLDALWVAYYTSNSFKDSQQTILLGAVSIIVITELLRWSMKKRLEVEQALRRTLQTSADIARSIPSGLLILQYDAPESFSVVDVNPAAEQLIGEGPAETRGKALDAIGPRGVFAGLKDVLLDVVRTGEPHELEWLCPANADPAPVLRIRAFLMPEERVGIAFEDVTDKKRAEGERLELEKKMQHAQKLESLGVLAGGIAHDFNNILLAILGNANLALRAFREGAAAEPCVEEIEKAARRGAELTRQMLAYSGKGRFVVKALDLTETVEEMTQLLRSSVSKRISLKLNLSPALPAIRADSAQIQQVVMNLITNAGEAFGEEDSGLVTVSTGVMECSGEYLAQSRLPQKPEPGTYVFIEVSDTGCGMSEETKAKMFEPFFTTKFSGRGLGTSAILGIVRGHGGAILVESEQERGTTVRVLFPAQEGRAGRDTKRVAKHEPPAERIEGTVLLVDDEKAVRILAARVLERLGLKVFVAADGRRGLDLFRAHADDIDCTILDLSMPNMDGIQTLRELRHIKSEARIILSSGFAEQELEGRLSEGEITAFIQKPYVVDDLEEIVRQVLRQ